MRAGARPEGRIRIASYNIRKAVGLDWRRKPDRILAVLDEIAPDIAVLQEADKRLGARPAALPLAMLQGHGDFLHLDPGPGPSLGWHGNAILLRRGLRGQITDRLTLPGLEPRGALVARITKGKGEGKRTFVVVAAHLGLNLGSRHQQMAAILEALRGLDLPIVLAGDLNERRPDRLLAPFEHRLTTVTPGPSFHAARPFVALDHLMLRGSVHATGTGVHASPLARVASDHLPIWADIEVGKAQADTAPRTGAKLRRALG